MAKGGIVAVTLRDVIGRLRPARPSGATLDQVLTPGTNGFGLVRLVLALMVVVDHAFPLAGHGIDPFWRVSKGQESLGGLAVNGFFALSGFLVVASGLRVRGVVRFLWHRVLRVFPGFLVCLAVTAFVAAPIAQWNERGTLRGLFSGTHGETPQHYLAANWHLRMNQYGIGGLLTHTPEARPGVAPAFDGSLWTLEYEFRCYVLLAVLVFAAVLWRARFVLPMITGVVAAAVVAQAGGHRAAVQALVPQLGNPDFARLLLFFLLGACAMLYGDRIPIDDRLGVVALAGVVWTLRHGSWNTLGVPLYVYTVLWLGGRGPVARWADRYDLSYGVYVYGYVIQQLLADYGVERHGMALYIGASIVITMLVALLSWTVVERPAMRLKSWRPRWWRTAEGAGDETGRTTRTGSAGLPDIRIETSY